MEVGAHGRGDGRAGKTGEREREREREREGGGAGGRGIIITCAVHPGAVFHGGP